VKPVYVAGVGLWTPGFATPRSWADGSPDPAEVRPSCALLESRIGRYTSLVTRMAVAALEQAGAQSGADLKDVQTVFGSAYGEIQIAFEQLDMIEREGVPSPARFKNSVHNTASGHVSIASGNMGFSTALAAGGATFAMCLLEAWVWLETHGGSVIVAVADEPLPDHLSSVARYNALGLAIHISAERRKSGTGGRLSALRRGDPVTSGSGIPDSLVQNPCAAGLPLIDAVLHERSATVPLELSGPAWSVDLQFGEGAR
jgi:hypothetical protein